MDDLDLIARFRSHVNAPPIHRVAVARAALQAQWQDAPAPRRRRLTRPRAALAALATAPIAAAAALLVLAGSVGGNGLALADAAILRGTDRALAGPPHEILYTVLAGDGFVSHSWQMTSPPYAFLGDKGPVGTAVEQAANGTTTAVYDPGTNTIHAQASPGPPTFSDPLAQVRQALQAGRARVLGTGRVDGVATYRIQFADKDGFSSQSLVADVDQRTYRTLVISDPQRNGSVVHLRVVTLEYLPATPANLRLLSLTDRHPTATVVADPATKPLASAK